MTTSDLKIIEQIYDWSQKYKSETCYKKDLYEFIVDIAREQNTNSQVILKRIENINPALAAGVFQVINN